VQTLQIFGIFKLNKYFTIGIITNSKYSIFEGNIGDLNPFPKGFLTFKKSSILSIFLQNVTVTLTLLKFSMCIFFKKVNASAVDALSVCVANLTFILLPYHLTWA